MNPVAIAFAVVLACSAIVTALIAGRARPAARDYLRFAAALYLPLAFCSGFAAALPDATTLIFSDAVTLVVCALAPVALALALFAGFEHPPSSMVATIILALACLAGIAAAASGTEVLSLAPLSVCVLAMLALCARRWRIEKRATAHAFLSACSLLAGAAAMGGESGRTALLLFSAAALLGFGLALARRSQVAVVNRRDLRGPVAVGEKG
ncbi:MAG TPA: hypothetical protein VLT91_15085 [Rhizomicrobium sp.]|nr:hypothetical protein [Rhizomicrobium sp.]